MSTSKAQPVTDPARPCWGFFQNILGREIVTPTDPVEARMMLRALLQEAYQTKPYSLIRMALFGNGKGGMRSQIEAFVAAYRNEGITRRSERTNRESDRDGQKGLGEIGMQGDWRSATDYLLSQWWVMGDGDKGITRSEKYRALDTNTNEPIRSWLPEGSGVVPYLRARTSHILYAYYENERGKAQMVSLDQCAQYRLELTSEGKFFRDLEGSIDEDAGVAPELQESREESEAQVDAAALVEASIEDSPLDRLNNEITPSKTGGHLAQIAELRGDAADRPETYGDWPLRMFRARYNPKWAASHPTYQRNQARILIEELAEIDSDIRSDLPTLLEILEEWDGTTPLVEALPEIDEAATRNAHQLIHGKEQQALVFSDTIGAEARRRAEELAISPSSITSKALAIDTVSIDDLMSSSARDFDLNSPSRPDYLFLASNANESIDWNLTGESLHRALMRLATGFSDRAGHAQVHGKEVYDIAVRNWNPSKDLFSSALMHLGRLVMMQAGRQHELDTASQENAVAVQEGFGF